MGHHRMPFGGGRSCPRAAWRMPWRRAGGAAGVAALWAAVVALGASCGAAGVASNSVPTIARFSPASGPVGTRVEIVGTNFALGSSRAEARFNGVAAQVIGSTSTSLTAVVPEGATTGLITVSVNGWIAASDCPFVVEGPGAQAPAIATQPSSLTVTRGEPATFEVAASGTAPLSYQWARDGKDIAGANGTTYTLVSAADSDEGSYTVTVSNAAGSATSSAATLTVTADPVGPSISTQPKSLEVAAGAAASFSVTASGTAPLSYQWVHDGKDIAGATGTTYTLASAAASDEGSYTVRVSNAAGSATSSAATLTVTAVPVEPSIATQPKSLEVAAGAAASFSVTASGTAPLSYQWAHDGKDIAGATGSTYGIPSASTANAGSYVVKVTNSAGSVTSSAAMLTVTSSDAPLSAYNLTGFATQGSGTTGGGVIAETDSAYRKCSTALDLAKAIADANKTAGAVKVIEIMNDLDLGWNEVGAAVQDLSSTPFRSHNAPKLHPALITSGVSVIDFKAKGGGVTLFSAKGATLRHAMLNIKSTSNVIIRNLEFDEMWEWDEATKGNYDSNDWDFIDLGNGGTVNNIWIDHCTFTKAYDGAVDIKQGSHNITFSWNKVVGDDGATNANSFVRQQINALEAKKASYPMYGFFRSNGFSIEDLVALHQGHDKTHLIGSNELDSTNAGFTVTFHHQWYKNTWDRLPRLRAGQVHNYNILADDSDELVALRRRDELVAAMSSSNKSTANNTYNLKPPLNGSISTEGGAVLVEKSAYVDCLWPLRNNQKDKTDSTYTGKILATDTIYTMHNADGTVTTVRGNSTDSSNPLGPSQAEVIPFSWNTFSALPYTYTLDDPGDLPALLQAGAGAGALTWAKENWLKVSY
jgi:pectate lyase